MLIAAVLALAACGGEAGSPGTTEPVFARWEAGEPDVRIGSVEGAVAWGRVSDLAVGPDRDVYVLDGQEAAVRVFDEAGRALGTVGRKGGGPGEFDTPRRIGFLGDTLWVWDATQRRLTFFGEGGAHLGTFAAPRAEGLREDEAQGFGTLAADGRALIGTRPINALVPLTQRFPLLVVDREGGSGADTVATLDVADARVVLVTLASGETWRPSGRGAGVPPPGEIAGIQIASQPFSDVSLWDVTAAGEAVVIVDREVDDAAGDAAFTITRVRLSGDTVFSVQRPYTPAPIPAAVTDSVVERYTESFDEAAVRDLIFLPPSYPPVDAVVTARDGATWLAREDVVGDSLQRWEVFDEAGEPLASVDLPADLAVYDATADAVWAVVTDELDVPFVVRIPVHRTSRGR